MSLFTALRGRRPSEDFADEAPTARDLIWQPVTGEVTGMPGQQMDDPGCAGTAYGLYYQLEDDAAPMSMLTVWTYPVYGNHDEGGFVLGRRFEYAVYRNATAPWLRADWMCATEDTSVYPDVDAAEQAARRAAEVLAKSAFPAAHDGGSLTGFEWDGRPW